MTLAAKIWYNIGRFMDADPEPLRCNRTIEHNYNFVIKKQL